MSILPDPTVSSKAATIRLRGVRTQHLQGFDLDLPCEQLTVVTGVSGAGQATLLFDVLYAESQRRYLETFPAGARRQFEQWEQPAADDIGPLPPTIAARLPRHPPSERSRLADVAGLRPLLQELYIEEGEVWCDDCQHAVQARAPAEIAQQIQSWPAGMRFALTFRYRVTPDVIPDRQAADLLQAGFHRVLIADAGTRSWQTHEIQIPLPATWPDAEEWYVLVDRLQSGPALETARLLESLELALQQGAGQCSVIVLAGPSATDVLPQGAPVKWDGKSATEWRLSSRWICTTCAAEFQQPELALLNEYTQAGGCSRCARQRNSAAVDCEQCHGTRRSLAALAVRWRGRSFPEFLDQSVSEALDDVAESGTTSALGATLSRSLRQLQVLGLGAVPCSRLARDLGAGEWLRARLVAARNSQLVSALCLVDEPSAGLPEALLPALITFLREWQTEGNTLVVADHHPLLQQHADWLVALGPGAGSEGGRLLYQGRVSEWTDKHPAPRPHVAETVQSSQREIVIPAGICREVTFTAQRLQAGRLHRLDCTEAYAARVWLTEWLPTVCKQSPNSETQMSVISVCGWGSRLSRTSTPVTAIEAWGEIRKLLAETPEAKLRQFTPGSFSWQTARGGRCPECQGQGTLEIDLQFLPEIQMECPACHGTRFTRDLLAVTYRGKTVAEILQLSAAEALTFFRGRSKIQRRMKLLKDVGLGSLLLGQSLETLSRGELRRLRFACALRNPVPGGSLFLFEDPLLGLHPTECAGLLTAFQTLLEQGQTIIVWDQHPALQQASVVGLSICE